MFELMTVMVWVGVITFIVLDQRRIRRVRAQKLQELRDQGHPLMGPYPKKERNDA